MMSSSLYLSDLAKKRANAAKMAEGMAGGVDQAIKGLGMLATLQAKLKEEGLAAEAKAHGRETEERNQARADTRFEWEKADRAAKAPAPAAPGEPVRAFFKSGDLPEQSNVPATQAKIRKMLAMGGGDDEAAEPTPDDEAAEGEGTDLRAVIENALGRTSPLVTEDTKQKLLEQRVRKETAQAGLAEKKLAGAGSPKGPKGPPSAKERKAEADAAIAEAKAANLGKPGTPKVSEGDKTKLQGIRESAGAIDRLIAGVEETGTGADVALRNIGGRIPLVGEKIDPGAKARTLFNNLEAFKKGELARLSGAGVSDKEKAAFEKFNASVGDTPETALAALRAYKVSLAEAEKIRVGLITDPLNLGAPAPSGAGVERRGAAPPSFADLKKMTMGK